MSEDHRRQPEDHRRQTIAARIREARRLSGLSQGQVAKLLGLHRPAITEMEAGNRRVSADELLKLAEIYEVNVAYLIGEAPETLAVGDPKIELAARELSKLSPENLDRLLRALAVFRTERDDGGKP
jgi:transcriptional regulator with XRE-family HTH domain